MIHTLLNITRPLFTIDTETTGLTDDARIIELGFQEWSADGLVKEWRSLIDPCIPIPAGPSKVHGITNQLIAETCRRCSRPRADHPFDDCPEGLPVLPFKHYATRLAQGFSTCDFSGKNVRFDLRRLSFEMKRAGVPWSYVGARIIDAERLEALANPRDLGTLYKKYTGKDLEGAHGALADVKGTTEVVLGQLIGRVMLQAAPVELPRDLDALHEAQWPGWLTACGSFRMMDDVPIITFGKHKYKAMQDVPRDYYDWMLGQDFPADVRQLAADAKLGKFPGGDDQP